MAYSTLKAAIQAVIKQNGNNEITGLILQQALLSMINSLGDGYQLKGVATPATNPGTPDQNVFYIASEVGTYSNFGLSVGENEVAVFLWNGSWSKQSTGAASAEAVSQLGAGYQFIGVATPTNPGSAQTPDYKCFYLATTPGTYTYLGGLVVADGEVALLKWDSAWTKEVTGIASADQLNQNAKIVPYNNGTNAGLIQINPTTIVIPSATRIYYGNNKVYRLAENKTIPRVAVEGAGYTEEIVCFNPNTGVFACFGASQITTESGYICLFGLGRGISWTTLEFGTYKMNGYAHSYTKVMGMNAIIPNSTRAESDLVKLNAAIKVISIIAVPGVSEIYFSRFYYSDGTFYCNIKYTKNGVLKGITTQTTISAVSNYVFFAQNEDVRFSMVIDLTDVGNLIYTGTLTYSETGIADQWIKYDSSLLYGVSTQQGIIYPPFTSGIYIDITDTQIIIPSNTRMICGEKFYRTTSEIRLDRSVTDQAQIVLYNIITGVFSLVSFAFYAPSNGEFVMFVVVNGTEKGCSLPMGFYTINGKTWKEQAYEVTNPIELNTPSQLEQKLVEQCYVSPSYSNPLQTPGLLTLLWFSDIHGDTIALNSAIKAKTKYAKYINDWIHTGDAVANYISDDNIFESVPGAISCLNVVGNHEAFIQGDTDYNATEKQCYDKIIANCVSSWGVVQPVGAATNGYCYYYKDYTTQGFRLIVLDSVHWHIKTGESPQANPTQKAWFESVLADAKTAGLKVICATHYPPQAGIIANYDAKGFTSFLQGSAPNPIVGDDWFANEEMFDCVDAFIADGGSFICWIMGHTHSDWFGVVAGHTNQNIVLIERAGVTKYSPDNNHIADTKTQNAFNIISFDSTYKLIKITRYGNSCDKYMRPKEMLGYRYDIHEIMQ